MAGECKVQANVSITGLDHDLFIPISFTTTTVPTACSYLGQKTQAVADTAEAMELGTVTTPILVIFHCITNDCDIDTSYSSSFTAEIKCGEGEWRIFQPEGTVYIKNDDAAEQVKYEAWVVS